MAIKKHPFILFELLIAIGLVTFTTLPFVQYPFLCLQKESDSLIRMELERAIEVAFFEIKADLYQNNISWETLTKRPKSFVPDIQKTITISLPGNIQKTYTEEVCFSLSKQKKGAGDQELFLVKVNAIFKALKGGGKLKIEKEILIKQMPKK